MVMSEAYSAANVGRHTSVSGVHQPTSESELKKNAVKILQTVL